MLKILVSKMKVGKPIISEGEIVSPKYNYNTIGAIQTPNKDKEVKATVKTKQISNLLKVYERFNIASVGEVSYEYLAKLKKASDKILKKLKTLNIKTLNSKLKNEDIDETIQAKTAKSLTFKKDMISDLKIIINDELKDSSGKRRKLFSFAKDSLDLTSKLIIYSAGNNIQGLASIFQSLPLESKGLSDEAYQELTGNVYSYPGLSGTDCIRAINYLVNLINPDRTIAINEGETQEEKLELLCSHLRVFLLTLNKHINY